MFSYTVKVFNLSNPKSKLVGFASLIIEDVLQIEGFKIFDGTSGLFVKPPSHQGKNKDGEETWFDDVRFIQNGKTIDFKDHDSPAGVCRKEIYKSMIDEYLAKSSQSQSSSRSSAARSQSEVNQRGGRREPLW